MTQAGGEVQVTNESGIDVTFKMFIACM